MIDHVLTAVQALDPQQVVAVVGHQRDQVGPHIQALMPDVTLAVQEEQQGTGHAVRVARAAAGTTTGTVLVAAETPVLRGESLRDFAGEHRAADCAVSVLSGIVPQPHGYGRIVRNDEGENGLDRFAGCAANRPPTRARATRNGQSVDFEPGDAGEAVNSVEIVDECPVVDICVDRYLCPLYRRTPKEDTIKELERRNVTIKRKGKMVTVAQAFKLVDEDFGWKDPKAAERAGMSLMDYVIGGMDRNFKLKLFHTLRAAEAAPLCPASPVHSGMTTASPSQAASRRRAIGRTTAGAPAGATGMGLRPIS